MNPGLASKPLKLMEMTGICSYPAFFSARRNEADVVGRTAAAAGLADDHGQVVGVVLSGKDSVHNLSDDDEGRIAGVIVYVFEAHVHSLTVVVGQHFDLVSCSLEGGLQQFEMDGRHLRAEDGVGSFASLL